MQRDQRFRSPQVALTLGGRFGYFFFCLGGGEGGVRGAGVGGEDSFTENPRRGGLRAGGGGGGEGPGRCFAGNLEGGLNIFLGAEIPTKTYT